jgi:predicted nucleic acid-binding protein
VAESLPFLDTNILLRHLTHDHADHSPRATRYLSRIEGGDLKVRTADSVVFETVFTLQRQYHQAKATIRELVLPIIELPGVVLPGKTRLGAVFDL